VRLSRLPWILAALFALPAAGAPRILVENRSDPSARVTVGFAQGEETASRDRERAATDEVVVDAPSPKRRLRGGTLQTDPMIDLIARRQLRESSPAPVLQVVNTGDAPAVFAPSDGPLVYDDGYAGGFWGTDIWGAGWYSPRFERGCCTRDGGRRPGGDRRQGGERARPQPPREPVSGGSVQARGMIHRPSR
jgi:hypothetical protein